jgi:hypothetical protein
MAEMGVLSLTLSLVRRSTAAHLVGTAGFSENLVDRRNLTASRVEDYGIIGNTRTAALVSREGSIDWLCAPRFDSDACFSALIGYDEHAS